MLHIGNATLLTPSRRIENGAVLIDGERIVAVGQAACPPEAQKIDATGLLLSPGFMDLQCNGAFGHDFTANPETIWPVAARLPQYGVTSFLPTIITSPLATVTAAQAVLQHRPANFVGARPLGLHVEGPFLNPAKRGAHNPQHLRLPEVKAVENWSIEHGVRLVTLAPELPNALEVTRLLVGRGVVVSAGHSMATFEEARRGIEAGITYGTHLFNAMPAFEHRAPGLAGALLTEARVAFGLIPDGVHLHPAVVTLAWQAAGPERVTLVTDAMAALGMRPGRYRLGDLNVIVDNVSARLADGRLAGSILGLDAAVRNLRAFTECSVEEAIATVTATPAKVLGLAHQRGQISPGFVADLVLLTPDLQVAMTIVNGEVVFQVPSDN